MNISKTIADELKELAPHLVSQDPEGTTYRAPEGYFEQFAGKLMVRIRLESEPEYISPLLTGLRNKPTYTVPDDYFRTVGVKIPKVVTGSPLVALPPKKPAAPRRIAYPLRAIRYAAAACIIALLGIVAYNTAYHPVTDPINALTAISDNDMANYLDSVDFHIIPEISLAPETASMDFSDGEIHELFSSVTDAELEDYAPLMPPEKSTVN